MQKRNRLTQLPQSRLIDLVLRASSLQPSLPLFPTQSSISNPPTTAGAASSTYGNTMDLTTEPDAPVVVDEPYDGYDTDPPAHYPKAGNGLARTLRPETEDLEWLVDENADVFSHQVGSDIGMNGS